MAETAAQLLEAALTTNQAYLAATADSPQADQCLDHDLPRHPSDQIPSRGDPCKKEKRMPSFE